MPRDLKQNEIGHLLNLLPNFLNYKNYDSKIDRIIEKTFSLGECGRRWSIHWSMDSKFGLDMNNYFRILIVKYVVCKSYN